MPDGTRLAARLWLSLSAAVQPVPAVLEYIPYRKADMVHARDERNHPEPAANGLAALRADMRGSSDREGLMYDGNEFEDARHVIEWLAAQPWCNGRVGMFGTSWGVLGPWGHHYPDQGHPGPGIGYQDLMLEWWHHWLMEDRPEQPGWPRPPSAASPCMQAR